MIVQTTNHLIEISKKTYFEELHEMPFKTRCMVLAIAMQVPREEILNTLQISKDELNDFLNSPTGEKWNFLRAIIDA